MVQGHVRLLYPSYIGGKRICRLSRDAECWFWRIYMVADDFGNTTAEPTLLLAATKGMRKEETEVMVVGWVKEMELAGLVRLYLVRDDWFLHILSFVSAQPASNSKNERTRRVPASPWDDDEEESKLFAGKHLTVSVTGDFPSFVQPSGSHTRSTRDVFNSLSNKNKERQGAEATSDGGKNERRNEWIRARFDHWRTVMKHPNAQLTPERRRKLAQRFEDSTAEEVDAAIDGCAASDFHMARGKYEGQSVYDDLDLIVRNRGKVEDFGKKVRQFRQAPDDRARRADDARRRWESNG